MYYLAKPLNDQKLLTPVELEKEFKKDDVLTDYSLEFNGEYYPCSVINKAKYENTSKSFININYYARLFGEHEQDSVYIKAKDQVIWYYNEHGKPEKLLYGKGTINRPTYFEYKITDTALGSDYKRVPIPFNPKFEPNHDDAVQEVKKCYFNCLEIFDAEPLNDEVLNNYHFVITGNSRIVTQQILKTWARLNGVKNISNTPRKRIKNIFINLYPFPILEASFLNQVELAEEAKLESWLTISLQQFIALAYNKVYKDNFKISTDLLKKSRLLEVKNVYNLLAANPFNGKQQTINCWPRQAKALITELNAMEKF
jgi:hypothetical protein